MNVTRLSGCALLKISDEKLRHRHKAAEEIERRIAPFREEIEHVASHFSDKPVHGAGMTVPSVRTRIGWFLERYVVLHGRMPEGQVAVNFTHANWHWTMGTYDFDEAQRRKG
jgi:hypothetical protein